MAVTHIALLRGVNVGGKNKLPMKDLAAMFTVAGCSNVRTYIQSGNVVFEAAPRLAAKIPALITAGIETRFGFETTLVLRTVSELRETLSNNPLLKQGAPEETLSVYFLADLPSADQVRALDPNRSPTDRYIVCGREIFAQHPNGMGNTKLTNAYFDSRLNTTSTARNWRTVGKLLEMASSK